MNEKFVQMQTVNHIALASSYRSVSARCTADSKSLDIGQVQTTAQLAQVVHNLDYH